jgi:hypothetical protein
MSEECYNLLKTDTGLLINFMKQSSSSEANSYSSDEDALCLYGT